MASLIAFESQVTKKQTPNYESLVEKWIEFAQVKPASVVGYMKGIKNFFAFSQANGISEITREVLLAYRDYLRTNYKPASANLYLTATKLFVSYLHQEGFIPVNVAERIKNFKITEGHAKDALGANTVKKIFAGLKTSTLGEKRDAAIFASMVCCGLRDVEVVRADVGDMVNRGEKIFLYLQGKGRDDKGDCVELPQGVYRMIQNYLAARDDVTKNSPLFASVSNRNRAGRLTTTSISRLIKGILRKNKIDSKRLTAHSMRHTCATTMLQNGVELRKVQEVLRHKSVTVTERYLHDLERYNNNGESIAAAAFGLD